MLQSVNSNPLLSNNNNVNPNNLNVVGGGGIYNALRNYSSNDIYNLLLSCNVPKSDCKILLSESIDGLSIINLNDSLLKQFGINTFGRRNKLINLIQQLINDKMLDLNFNNNNNNSNNNVNNNNTVNSGYIGSNMSIANNNIAPTLSNPNINNNNSMYYNPMLANYNNNINNQQNYRTMENINKYNTHYNYLDNIINRNANDSNNIINSPNNNKSSFRRGRSKSSHSIRFNSNYRNGNNEIGIDDTDDDINYNKYSSKLKHSNTRNRHHHNRSSSSSDNDDNINRNKFQSYSSEEDDININNAISGLLINKNGKSISSPSTLIKNKRLINSGSFNNLSYHSNNVGNMNYVHDDSKPSNKLLLEWVYGYKAFDSRSNLLINKLGFLIYPVASLIVIYNINQNHQTHFIQHSNEIKAITQNHANHNLIASAQSSGIIHDNTNSNLANTNSNRLIPYICIFDSSLSNPNVNYIRLELTESDISVRCLSFIGSSGEYLISISSDSYHCIKIFDWSKQTLLIASKTDTNTIYNVISNNHYNNDKGLLQFTSIGRNHIAIWNYNPNKNKLIGQRADFTGFNNINISNISFISAIYSELGYIVAGSLTGDIYVFKGYKLIKIFNGIHKGKILTMFSLPNYGLITAASDGVLNILDKKMSVIKSIQFKHKVISVVVDLNKGSYNKLYIGTQGGEIYLINNLFDSNNYNDELVLLVNSHFDGLLNGLAIDNSNKYFLTSGHDNQLCLWDFNKHKLIKKLQINENKLSTNKTNKSNNKVINRNNNNTITNSTHSLSCCSNSICIHPNGSIIALSTLTGELILLQSNTFNKLLHLNLGSNIKKSINNHNFDDSTSAAINCMIYSNNGDLLILGSVSGIILILNAIDGYRVTSVINIGNHTNNTNNGIKSLDISIDDTILQVSIVDYELFHYSIEIDSSSSNSNNNAINNILVNRIPDNNLLLRDVVYSSISTPLNWSIHGIFDASNINNPHKNLSAVNCSINNNLVLGGSYDGSLYLYRYPCYSHKAEARIYNSHHVGPISNIQSNSTNQILFTTGQKDRTILQWKIV